MERNTPTVLGKLQIDDRFYFDAESKEVWQVVSISRDGCYINRFHPNGSRVFKHDTLKGAALPVVFLRNANQ